MNGAELREFANCTEEAARNNEESLRWRYKDIYDKPTGKFLRYLRILRSKPESVEWEGDTYNLEGFAALKDKLE